MKEKIRQMLKTEKKALLGDLQLVLALLVLLFLMHFSGIGCPFRFFFGIPCAGCGMSRALLELLQGHGAEAVRLHPLVVAMPFAAVLWLFRRHIPEKYRKPILSVMIAAFLITYFVRIAYHDPALPVRPADGFLMRIVKEVQNVLS